MSEEISSYQNLSEVIDHTCDENGNNLLNSEEERMSHPFIISMQLNTYVVIIIKTLSINIMHHLYHQIIIKIYLLDQNIIQQNKLYVVIKKIFEIYY